MYKDTATEASELAEWVFYSHTGKLLVLNAFGDAYKD